MPIHYRPETKGWELVDPTKEEWDELINLGRDAFMQYFATEIFRKMADKITPEQIMAQQMEITDPKDLPQA